MGPNMFLSRLRGTILGSRFLILTACAMLLAASLAEGQRFTVLYSFQGPPDGQAPDTVILDSAGVLYGITAGGGASSHGSAFKLTPDGKETVLYSFLGGYGAYPQGQLVRDAKGTLYGSTIDGGWYNGGAVFELREDGSETVLYSFRGKADGGSPNGVIRDAQGSLYGTTISGGAGSGCYYGFGCGTVFKVTPSGKEKVLYRFKGGTDGGNPYWAGLARDWAGNLYGTTSIGGKYGAGTVFRLDAAGRKTTLYDFAGSPGDGAEPAGSLVQDKTGVLYGTTSLGGNIGGSICSSGCGTVFKLEPNGKETVLYKFTGTGGDGANPYVGVVVDAAGNIYGTTQNGGQTTGNGCGCGVVFLLDPSGKETILHTFTDGTDGAFPNAELVLDAAGNIYGAADSGGDCSQQGGCGTVFKLMP